GHAIEGAEWVVDRESCELAESRFAAQLLRPAGTPGGAEACPALSQRLSEAEHRADPIDEGGLVAADIVLDVGRDVGLHHQENTVVGQRATNLLESLQRASDVVDNIEGGDQVERSVQALGSTGHER